MVLFAHFYSLIDLEIFLILSDFSQNAETFETRIMKKHTKQEIEVKKFEQFIASLDGVNVSVM